MIKSDWTEASEITRSLRSEGISLGNYDPDYPDPDAEPELEGLAL